MVSMIARTTTGHEVEQLISMPMISPLAVVENQHFSRELN